MQPKIQSELKTTYRGLAIK